MYDTLYYYLHYYERSLVQRWHALGPMDYGILLALVGVVGWITMKSRMK